MVLTNLDSGLNLAVALIGDRNDAEDVLQEASVKAFKAFGQFHGDNGKAWFLKIVRNECMNVLQQRARSKGREMRMDEELDAVTPSPDDPMQATMADIDRNELIQAINALPFTLREVILLRELEDMSYRHIAGVVGVPIGTVMSRLSRARSALFSTLSTTGELS